MQFEWDDAKSRENVRKHGIDFCDATSIFTGPVFEDLDDREDYGEDRWIAFGLLGEEVIVVVYTERKGKRRIISARKARPVERRYFFEAIAKR